MMTVARYSGLQARERRYSKRLSDGPKLAIRSLEAGLPESLLNACGKSRKSGEHSLPSKLTYVISITGKELEGGK
jgi:hypothetical protein